MTNIKQGSVTKRRFPIDEEGDNIIVGGKQEKPNGRERKRYGDISFWLEDRRRRETKAGLLGQSSGVDKQHCKSAAHDEKAMQNKDKFSSCDQTICVNEYRKTPRVRYILDRVEIVTMVRKAHPAGSYQPARASASVADPTPPSRSTRRKSRVNYTEITDLDGETSDTQLLHHSDAESSDFEQHHHEEHDMRGSSDDEMASDASESDYDEEPPAAKKQKISNSASKSARKAPNAATETHPLSLPGSSPSSTSDGTNQAPRKPKLATRMRKLHDTKDASRLINLKLAPMSTIADIFLDITKKAVNPDAWTHTNLVDAVKHLGGRPLRVGTMCSGTESPLLALDMVSDSLKELKDLDLYVEHVFSAEIEPFKQAYIERNFHPPIIFRDIVEIVKARAADEKKATTAYGGMVEIPQDVDLLIAGTACVDFSRLNNKPKTLEEEGESGDTFAAVLAYAETYRPSILILENVSNAPWDGMLRRYEDIGYEVAGVKVDTKNFYLPQTRQRGYMVCFDKEKKPSHVGDGQLSTWWQDIMEEMKRQVSSPISDFLLPDDDARVVRSRQRSARQGLLDPSLKAVDWAKCDLSHTMYRKNNRLGNNRPLTEWQESGSTVLPEHFDKSWYKRQPERVWDFAEMSFLRKAKDNVSNRRMQGRYDIQYKTRVWDVSQNIYRFTDCAPFGIASCLTPSGTFYLSDRGGPLMDVEGLITQGLPLDRISFTTESPAQIQDLAGNAMSSPVVGSAIVAALMVGHKVLKVADDSVLEYKKAKGTPTIKGTADFDRYQQTDETDSGDFDITLFLEEAQRSSRKCLCEGQINVARKPIQTCLDCHHTSCITCGVKPSHNYEDPQHLNRDSPEGFIQKWRRRLPMQIHFEDAGDLEASFHSRFPENWSPLENDYVKAVSNAINCSLAFKELRRLSYWVVTYESPYARLELVLDGEVSEWRLFLKPDRTLAGENELRVFSKQAVAKSTINSGEFFGEHWNWRVPKTLSAVVTVKDDGDPLPSWAARLGLPDYADEVVPSQIRIQTPANCKFQEDISGLYEHLPDCGTACSSMYKRVNSLDSRDLFFFLDPGKITDPNQDSFVFAFDHSKLQYGQDREIVCSLDAKWRPWNQKRPERQLVKSDGKWINDVEFGRLADTGNKSTFAIYGDSPVHHDCKVSKAIASCSFEVPGKTEARFDGDRQIQPDDKAFFETFNWALEPLRRDLGYRGKHVLDHDAHVNCQDCAPPLPEVRWNLARKGKKVKRVVFRPYEDVQTATFYEVALKSRPQPFVLQSRIEDGRAQLDIGVSVLSLCQRAVGKLYRLTNEFDSVSWALDTVFSNDGAISAPPFALRGNDQDVAYTRKVFGFRANLFDEQQRSLGWMRNQEAGDGKEFVLKEVEEALLPHLGWRLEAEAIGIEHVRGGILADHAGFGKTITSLGLIHSEFLDRGSAANIVANMKDLERDDPSQVVPRKIAATLVICPRLLLDQWKEEIIKYLGQDYAPLTITIKDMNDLTKHCSVGKFEKARIILVSRTLLEHDRYRERLAVFGGVPECMSKGTREVKPWLEMATRNIPAHLDILQSNGLGALKTRLKNLYTNHLDNENLRAFAQQSKRVKGEAYAKQKATQSLTEVIKVTTEELMKDRPTLKDNELKNCVLFEMFHFNRIIVDEFSYLSPGDLYTFGAIRADKRWGLSGTPRLKDAYDVSQMANLLGVSLPVGASAHGTMSNKNMRALRAEMTDLELFETFKDAPSRVIQEKSRGLAQNFLDVFVRQNVLDSKKWKYDDLLVPIVLNADHRVIYTDISQQLNSQDMHLRKGKKTASTQGNASSAEEVLLKDAALYMPNNERVTQIGTANSSLATLVKDRYRDCRKAKKAVKDKIKMCSLVAQNLKLADCPLESWAAAFEKDVLGDEDLTSLIREMIGKIIGEPSKKRSFEEISDSPSESSGFEDSSEDEVEALSKDQAEDSLKGEVEDFPEDEAEISPKEDDYLGKDDGPKGALKTMISEVNQMVKAFVTSVRSFRFANQAYTFDKHRSGQGEELRCECEECLGNYNSPKDLSVSAACGHVICTPCFEDLTKHALKKCGAVGCSKDVRPYHLLSFNKIGDVALSKYGKKADTVVDLLKYIRGEKQKAILFIQFEDHIKKIAAMLEEEQIIYETAKDHVAVGRFKENRAVTVLLLNSSDVSAAGMNLTAANHVIFFSPVLKESQYEYDAQMAQGVGRVRRHGQGNPIYVYRMTSLNTIDVDVLEQRERLTDMLVDTTVFNPDAVQVPGGGRNVVNSKPVLPPTEPERTQLIRDPGDELVKLVPKSLLIDDSNGMVEGKFRVKGYEDFSSLVKFSKTFLEDDDE